MKPAGIGGEGGWVGAVSWAKTDLGRKGASVKVQNWSGRDWVTDTFCHQWEPGEAGGERWGSVAQKGQQLDLGKGFHLWPGRFLVM